jgi:hypothetical protein
MNIAALRAMVGWVTLQAGMARWAVTAPGGRSACLSIDGVECVLGRADLRRDVDVENPARH